MQHIMHKGLTKVAFLPTMFFKKEDLGFNVVEDKIVRLCN